MRVFASFLALAAAAQFRDILFISHPEGSKIAQHPALAPGQQPTADGSHALKAVPFAQSAPLVYPLGLACATLGAPVMSLPSEVQGADAVLLVADPGARAILGYQVYIDRASAEPLATPGTSAIVVASTEARFVALASTGHVAYTDETTGKVYVIPPHTSSPQALVTGAAAPSGVAIGGPWVAFGSKLLPAGVSVVASEVAGATPVAIGTQPAKIYGTAMLNGWLVTAMDDNSLVATSISGGSHSLAMNIASPRDVAVDAGGALYVCTRSGDVLALSGYVTKDTQSKATLVASTAATSFGVAVLPVSAAGGVGALLAIAAALAIQLH